MTYAQSKTANVLFGVELDRRYRDAGLRAFAVHPGIVTTDLGRHLTAESIAQVMSMAPSAGEPLRSAAVGAATAVRPSAARSSARGPVSPSGRRGSADASASI